MSNRSKSNILSELSVIIPTFNGSAWLPETINRILVAIRAASINKFEIIVVNDGSTDDTIDVVESINETTDIKVRLVNQNNSGRFMARKRGCEEAKYDFTLFVDTRVFIAEGSLKYVKSKIEENDKRVIWCSHVKSDSETNIYGRFWEAIAFIAWRQYFSNPRDVEYSLDEFDKYPKGTTCFLVRKDIMLRSNKWFLTQTRDLKTSNDDTLLIRNMAADNTINVSPEFWCIYHARRTLRQYTKHVYHRGKVFVDGFLRNDGNVFFVPLLLFLVLTIAVFVAIILNPSLIAILIPVALFLWLAEFIVVLFLGLNFFDSMSLFILTPIFAVIYGAGIWSAVIKIYVLNRLRRNEGNE